MGRRRKRIIVIDMNEVSTHKRDVRGNKTSPFLRMKSLEKERKIALARTSDRTLAFLITMPNGSLEIKRLAEKELRRRHNGKLRIEL